MKKNCFFLALPAIWLSFTSNEPAHLRTPNEPAPVFCIFTNSMCMKCLFCKKKSVHLAFSSRRNANCNCPPRIGGHHFLLCQHTNILMFFRTFQKSSRQNLSEHWWKHGSPSKMGYLLTLIWALILGF